jgi:hypothetical protein
MAEGAKKHAIAFAAARRTHPDSPRFDSAAGAGQLFHARESLMSHAEYAPKRLPVLKRLAIALRQIPAVEFALSRFKMLLRGRTNAEQAVTAELLPPPSDVAKDEGETGTVAKEPSEPDTALAAAVETERPVTSLVESQPIGIDAAETADVETANAETAAEIAPIEPDIVAADDGASELTEPQAEPVEANVVVADTIASDVVEIDNGEATSVEIEAIADDADETIVEADQVAPVATACEPSETHAEPVVIPDAVASDTDKIDVGESPSLDIETIADETDETIVEADQVAPIATAAGDVPEEEIAADEEALPAAADEIEIEIEIEAVEAPCITAEPVEIEAAEPCVATIDSVEAPALGADDVVSPEAVASGQTAQEPEPLAVTPDVAVPDALSEREALIRRRWNETGIMMWRGVGQSTLCIQGSTALLPPKPGETMPQYDRLEFRLIDGLIVCEGFVVEAAPLKNRLLARAA